MKPEETQEKKILVDLLRRRFTRRGYEFWDRGFARDWDLVAGNGKYRVYLDVVTPSDEVQAGLQAYCHVLEHAGLPNPKILGVEVGRALAGVGQAATKALFWSVDHPTSTVALAWFGERGLDPFIRPITGYLKSYGIQCLVFPPTHIPGWRPVGGGQ